MAASCGRLGDEHLARIDEAFLVVEAGNPTWRSQYIRAAPVIVVTEAITEVMISGKPPRVCLTTLCDHEAVAGR